MIYLDTSVVLAQLFAEDRRPRADLWSKPLVSSRLLEYELWTRVHSRGLATTHGMLIREVLAGISIVEMTPMVLTRALKPFPIPVRTLDALHLASMEYLRGGGVVLELATYDQRMSEVAAMLGISVHQLG